MNKQNLLADFLCKSGALSIVLLLMKKSNVKILAYHRILSVLDESQYGADLELISASVEDFDWQMSYVKKNYNVISFSQLVNAQDKAEDLPENSLIITFDDGFDDNYTNAFPILKKYSLPATIFISTGYMAKKETFWFDWVVYVVKKIKQKKLVLDDGKISFDLADDVHQRQLVGEKLLEYLKTIDNKRRKAILDELEIISNMKMSDGCPFSRPLSWQQVKEMSENNIEFGSHSVNHPILSKLSDDDLMRELSESKKHIEDMLGVNCLSIAYPVGGESAYSMKVMKFVHQIGYKMAASYKHGVSSEIEDERFQLKRLHVERYTSREYFASMLALPKLFY